MHRLRLSIEGIFDGLSGRNIRTNDTATFPFSAGRMRSEFGVRPSQMDAGQTSRTGLPRGGGLRVLDRLRYGRGTSRGADRFGDRDKAVAAKQAGEA